MVTASYLVHYDSLLQNATDIITKFDSYFITKYEKSLSKHSSTKCYNFIAKCNGYYKMRRFYYKMRQLLQMQRLLQNTPLQGTIKS